MGQFPADMMQGMAQGIQQQQNLIQQQQNPGEERATRLTLTDLQEDDSGLENGALFQQDGFVKIALINKPHVRGSGATGAVGTVTVTTT